jgi:predicted PurR-regulated permease PerM
MPDSDMSTRTRMPRWVWKAVLIFWVGWLVAVRVDTVVERLYGLLTLLLVSMFLALAIEPGVNRLAKRGWRRGTATAVFVLGVIVGFVIFIVAIAALVGQQIADLLQNSEDYVTRSGSTSMRRT